MHVCECKLGCTCAHTHCCRERPPSRDMLIAQRSLLQSELDTLRKAVSAGSESKNRQAAEQTTNALEQRANATSDRRNDAVEAAISARNRCMQEQATNQGGRGGGGGGGENSEGNEDPCDQFEESADTVEDTTFENAGAMANYFSAAFLLKPNQQYQNYMQARMTALEREVTEINTKLNNLEGDQLYLGEIAEAMSADLNMKKEQDFNQWMKFHFNSETTRTSSSGFSFGLHLSVEGSVGIPGVGSGSRSHSLGLQYSETRKAFSNAKLQVSGQLLRVVIKRPWFKSSLFDNPILNFVSSDS